MTRAGLTWWLSFSSTEPIVSRRKPHDGSMLLCQKWQKAAQTRFSVYGGSWPEHEPAIAGLVLVVTPLLKID